MVGIRPIVHCGGPLGLSHGLLSLTVRAVAEEGLSSVYLSQFRNEDGPSFQRRYGFELVEGLSSRLVFSLPHILCKSRFRFQGFKGALLQGALLVTGSLIGEYAAKLAGSKMARTPLSAGALGFRFFSTQMMMAGSRVFHRAPLDARHLAHSRSRKRQELAARRAGEWFRERPLASLPPNDKWVLEPVVANILGRPELAKKGAARQLLKDKLDLLALENPASLSFLCNQLRKSRDGNHEMPNRVYHALSYAGAFCFKAQNKRLQVKGPVAAYYYRLYEDKNLPKLGKVIGNNRTLIQITFHEDGTFNLHSKKLEGRAEDYVEALLKHPHVAPHIHFRTHHTQLTRFFLDCKKTRRSLDEWQSLASSTTTLFEKSPESIPHVFEAVQKYSRSRSKAQWRTKITTAMHYSAHFHTKYERDCAIEGPSFAFYLNFSGQDSAFKRAAKVADNMLASTRKRKVIRFYPDRVPEFLH